MQQNFSSHLISPREVIRGKEAWVRGKHIIPLLCKRPLLLGKSELNYQTRKKIESDLETLAIKPISLNLNHGCCEVDLEESQSIFLGHKCDAVIATGGGKVLDAGKLLAYRLNVPCITIPLSAATCAGWTALSNIYSPDGAFIKDMALRSCPDLLIFDHNFIKKAPSRTLASGIADALAKWYESSLSSGSSDDGFVRHAIQMARVLRDQLLIDGYQAYLDSDSVEWTRTIEGCALNAGLIGGIGGAKCRTAAAHSIHNGLTQLNSRSRPLHGELVGFCILVQLTLEERQLKNQLAKQARIQLRAVLKKLGLPLTLEELGLNQMSNSDFNHSCIFTCNEISNTASLPFKINKKSLYSAIMDTSKEGEVIKQKNQSTLIRQLN